MKIKNAGDALEALEAIRAWTRTKLPEKQSQPWNGHSPEQCMLINVNAGLTTATYNLNRYEEVLKSMAGGEKAKPVEKMPIVGDDNPLL